MFWIMKGFNSTKKNLNLNFTNLEYEFLIDDDIDHRQKY